ncbi:MAG: hypothetical protein M1524_02045 [Patescibacteria group bacterium]|nr:hypothetical protein [Patescibacteria group bacterium]
MSKHKKTKQQKIISELRRKLNTQKRISYSEISEVEPKEEKSKIYQVTINKPITPDNSKDGIFIQQNPYLRHDLLKTAYLTGSILAAEIILFFVINALIK